MTHHLYSAICRQLPLKLHWVTAYAYFLAETSAFCLFSGGPLPVLKLTIRIFRMSKVTGLLRSF